MIVSQDDYPDPDNVYHAIIMVAYNEGMETLVPTVEAVKNTSFPNERIIFFMGYEERGGEEIAKCAEELKSRYKDTFYDFVPVMHPKDLPDEIKGKGPVVQCIIFRMASVDLKE